MRRAIATIALSALLAGAAQAHASVGVNRLDSEPAITANELELLGWYGLSYRVPFWMNMSDAERDALVAGASATGVRLLPILIVRYDGVAHEPRAAAFGQWAAYVDRVVRRYPGIRDWEIWNEPNVLKFGGTIAVHRWRPFVSQTARIVHRARAGARAVAGGVSVGRRGWRRYLHVANVDAVAIHPYTPTAASALRLIREARAIARKPIWATELGWTGGNDRWVATELRRFVRGFHGPTFWYHLHDNPNAARAYANDGLFTEAWKPKPVWNELLRGRAP
jgi:hypothetical protein